MGINLPHHKMLSFCSSSFFAGVGGALFAMYASNAQAMVYTSTMTYEILLIVVIGGIDRDMGEAPILRHAVPPALCVSMLCMPPIIRDWPAGPGT